MYKFDILTKFGEPSDASEPHVVGMSYVTSPPILHFETTGFGSD